MPEGMRLSIDHETRYDYAVAPPRGLYQLRLKPAPWAGQTVVSWALDIAGGVVEAEFSDQHRNIVTLVSLAAGQGAVVVRARGVVETADRAGVVGFAPGDAPLWLYRRQTANTRPGPGMTKLIERFGGRVAPGDIAALHALSEAVREAVRYAPGRTHVDTTAEEALKARAGVCQDHAHVFCGAARAMGVPCRYVSGYLLLDDVVRQDAGHAWVEAHVEGLGWVALDISNGISPDARYVRLAVGLDYAEAAPIKGVVAGTEESALSVVLQVQQ